MIIAIELTGTDYDGKWVATRTTSPPDLQWMDERGDLTPTDLIATGSVVWNGNDCAEVFVPRKRLALWRAEYEVDA